MGGKDEKKAVVAAKSAKSSALVPGDDAASAADSVKAAPPPAVGLLELFRYADGLDKFLMFIGALCGLGVGCAMPAFAIIFGDIFTDFQAAQVDFVNTGNSDELIATGAKFGAIFGYLAAGVFVFGFGQMTCFAIASERQVLRIRELYLSAVLRQEVSWFDFSQSGELVSQVSENTVVFRDAVGEKLGNLFQFMGMFLAGFAVGFALNWKLTLVIMSITPLLAIGGFFMMKMMEEATSGGLGAYAKAGGVASEAFTMIRTVASLGSEGRVSRRFEAELDSAEKAGIKKNTGMGWSMALTMGVYFMAYGLAFWYGAILVNDSQTDNAYPSNMTQDYPFCVIGGVVNETDNVLCQSSWPGKDYAFANQADVCNCAICNCGCIAKNNEGCTQGSDILTVFFAVVIGAFALGQAGPSISALFNGKAAAAVIFQVIEREPEIDPDVGEVPSAPLQGHIQLNNVTFRYPSRPDAVVFSNLTLDMPPNKSIALCGGSGCGKSTITQLVQRFYDPEEGEVLIDGRSLRELKASWLRDNIGLVSQEPVLFAATIKDNIKMGLPIDASVTDEDIHNAARAANAYDFIMDFPEGFDTFVGGRGSSLSGGQKQRIAIARAIIRDPAILILDEATSALDSTSERVVQQALDDLLKMKQRTTIIVAHRLSTIANADKIVVLGDGNVLEQGTHAELKRKSGHYAALLAAASRSQEGDSSKGKKASFKSKPAKSKKDDKPAADEIDEDEAAEIEEVMRQQSELEDVKDGAAVKKGKDGKPKPYKVSYGRIFAFSKEDKWLYPPAFLAAAINGGTMPVFAILFSKISTVYFNPTQEMVQDAANQFSLYFVIFSFIVGGAIFVQFYLWGLIAERMTTRVRSALFQAILRMEIGFYDRKANSVGVLTARLATDAALVKAAVADRMSLAVQNLCTLAIGLGIAFYFGWELTLVLFACLPLLAFGGAMQMIAMGNANKEDEETMKEANQVLSESLGNIRTVTAFQLRERLVVLYNTFLEKPKQLSIRRGLYIGAGFGFSQMVIFGVYGLAFYVGAIFMANNGYSFLDVLNVFFAITMAGMGAGQAAAFAPDIAKGSAAVSSVFRILDRKSKVDPLSDSGLKGDATSGDGDITVSDVNFTYPTRPDAPVFQNMNLKMERGTTTALVGQSGSGKSTIIQLIERFYDADSGSVVYDGVDTKQANPRWLRSNYGLVSQEPMLFSGTIYDNILEGLPEAAGENIDIVTDQDIMDRVEQAAKDANAHNFIMEFPDGYQTDVGEGGSMLSGGQKQRVCIARILMRNPKVLLLDEATSALDNISEQHVQQALDKLMEDTSRTTIVIAHRLSSISNADNIAVIDHGVVVEQGSFAELLERKGAFYALHKAQNSH